MTSGVRPGVGGRAAAIAAGLVLLSACTGVGTDPSSAPESEAPSLVSPDPAPATAPGVPVDLRRARVTALDLSGVRVRAGWSPLGLFGPDLGSWEDRFDELPDLIAPRRVDGVPAGALLERAEVIRDPAPCFAFERRVVDVSVDVPGAAGRAIERALMAEVSRHDAAVADAAAFRGADGATWCDSAFAGRRVGFHVVEVHREACAPPAAGPGIAGGRTVVCHTVGALGYLLGTRDTWRAVHLVHDGATGERLGIADMLPRVDPGLLAVLGDRIAAEVVRGADLPTDVPLALPLLEGDPLPSLEGMRWRWSPLTNLAGGVEVLVPWDVLTALAGPDWDVIDLGALAWESDCAPSPASRVTMLEPVSDPSEDLFEPSDPDGPLFRRRYEPDAVDGTTLFVDLSGAVRTDVDGDGDAEVIVPTACFLGNGWTFELAAWGMGPDGRPVQLPAALEYSKSDGYVVDLAAGDGGLLVTMRVGAPGDDVPHLNGYPRLRVTGLRLVDGAWVERIVSEVDVEEV